MGREEGDVAQASPGAPRQPGPRLAGALGWSSLAVLGRQASQIVAALVLARVLGPASYGVISAATVFVTFTTLLLDQGLAPAVVQRPGIDRTTVRAVATLNLLMALLLAGATLLLADGIAAFFNAPPLADLLRVLSISLLLKGAAITPRAWAMRHLRFRDLAVVDIGGGLVGAGVGIVAALTLESFWAMAWQVLATDVVVLGVLVALGHGQLPSRHLSLTFPLLPFSLRVFGTNALAFFSRNSDNILVGRYLGVSSLSLYSMAYRILVVPVQFVGQTVNRAVFPTLASVADDPLATHAVVSRATNVLAFAAVPPMALAAVAAPELVRVALGEEWIGAAPVLTILCVAGARETVFQVTHSLMRAQGRGRLMLRYEIGATVVQVAGIVAGLTWGIVGVAIGFTVAGFLLTPVLMLIQRRLSGRTLTEQVRQLLPVLHVSAWGCAAYALVGLLAMNELATLVLGAAAFLAAAAAALLVFHRRLWRQLRQGWRDRSKGSR